MAVAPGIHPPGKMPPNHHGVSNKTIKHFSSACKNNKITAKNCPYEQGDPSPMRMATSQREVSITSRSTGPTAPRSLCRFFDARDAIVQADRILTGGKNQCELWIGFSQRELGPDATIIGSTPWGRGVRTDDFDIPLVFATSRVNRRWIQDVELYIHYSTTMGRLELL
ncbi:uncharacterized protein EI90DRAFT_3069780 [Cantharellus anzutake]|uniref:uncharacterized protein n=1 Tax=Cantharellus anzutake TaxID=1750568 RepID=UPI0019044088|nr:uncharacterized protein EI90DRAFT_3069780 [Cantharellus anzutake]KAF8326580.1 hypothetical protein EI90DRAFT_3069780 [Cantharellus anzutake]